MERYGDFELQRLIATGGMAEIYLAKHSGFGGFSRIVVVKRMLPQLAVRPDFVQMFLDEARLAANLNHPNIVSVFNLGEVDGSYFIAMEFVDGPHLGSLFAHSLRLRRPLPIEHCVYAVARAADGLHYAHEQLDPGTRSPLNIVHRDISPQNVLVSREGDIKVTDFGVAKASTQQTKTRTGIIKGKVAYMSPEQCLGEIVDRRTDVFALGIVLYELLTRRRLFRDKSDLLIMQKITGEDVAPPSSVNRELDAEMDAICARALARDRDQRYSTAAELAEALDGWLVGKTTGDPRITLVKWFEQHALELAIGATIERAPSDESGTAQMRPAPGEQTAATPSLNSAETVMRPSSPEVTAAPRMTAPPTTGAGAGARPAARPAMTSAPPTSLPDRSRDTDEPTQRERRPDALRSDDADTMFMAPSPGDIATDEADDDDLPLRSQTASLQLAKKPTNPLWMAAAGVLVATALSAVAFIALKDRLLGESPAVAVGADGGDAAGADTEPGTGPAAGTETRAGTDAEAGTAKITVESVPPGVSLLLDDERIVGKTPVTFEHAAGPVKLQVQFDDQPPVTLELSVKPGEERNVRMLARVPLIVKSTPGKAKVKVDGEVVGETPFERKAVVAPERPVRIKLELAGYEFPERLLTPEAGAPLVVDLAGAVVKRSGGGPTPPAPAKFGLLNMRSSPWVQVKVKGVLLGNTTFTQARVPAGRQVLVMTNPESGINESLTVTIPEDKTLNVNLEWEQKGGGWKIKSRSIK